jgi:AcrR family transcriptional regulator
MIEKIMDKKELLQKFRTEGILDAAIKVIAQRGLEKATMEQVAEEAGISKATIYLYFKNKEDLYYHCVMTRFEKIMCLMRHAAEGVDDPVERIKILVNTQVKAMEVEKDFFRVFFTERMSLFLDQTTEFGQGFFKRHEEYEALVTGALKEGMERGVLREIDPKKAFSLLFSMVRGMAMFNILCEEQGPLTSEAGLILDVFFNGLKPYGGI